MSTTPSRPLPTAAPSEEGVDADGILALVEALEQSPAQQPHGLMVLRRGRVIAQGWWAPYTAERPQLVYSLSKSFTSAAAGIAFDDGLLDLDAPVIDYFPEFAADIVDERSRRILVRHAASMASGHLEEMRQLAFETDLHEPVRGFLLHPPEREPGSIFTYNQPTTYTLAAIVQRLTGRTLVELLRERVLGPLGAGDIAWSQHPAGRDVGFTGAFMTTDTAARLGQLLLQEGQWQGRRILSEEWVRLATTAQIDTAPRPGDAGNADWVNGYGFQHWVSQHGYRGDGAFGQYCLVLPEQEAVIAYLGESQDLQGMLSAVWEHLLPACDRPGSPEADHRLADRLAAAELPPLKRAAEAAGDASRWNGAVFDGTGTPGADGSASDTDAGRVAEAEVRHTDGGWQLIVRDPAGDVTADFEPGGGWRVTDDGTIAVALSGGFDGADRLELDIAFLEAPHRLRLRLELPPNGRRGALHARWRTVPLRETGGVRTGLAAPRTFG